MKMTMPSTDWIADYLPQQLRDLIDVIGMDATKRLVDEFGGLRLHVPLNADSNHRLCRLLGVDSFKTLVHHYGGERMDIAKAQHAILAVRNLKMQKDHVEGGVSARRLAIEYRLTERQVWYILAQQPVDDQQIDLFPDC